MTRARDRLVQTIWHGLEPYENINPDWPVDKQGWGSNHDYLSSSVAEIRPSIVLEIGVWKGMSVITLAKKLRELELDGVVVAIDTWLGSSEHWIRADYFRMLASSGRQAIQNTFMANVANENLQDYVLPFPIDSINASVVLRHYGIVADIIHIDAGHDHYSVLNDLRSWWTLLRPGGILIGDDYYPEKHWPGVKSAFVEFLSITGLNLEHRAGKCLIRKPCDPVGDH